MIEAVQAYLDQVAIQTGTTVAVVAALFLVVAVVMAVKGWRSRR